MHLAIMNYRTATIHMFQFESQMDNEEVELWIMENTDFSLSEISYMSSTVEIEVVNG